MHPTDAQQGSPPGHGGVPGEVTRLINAMLAPDERIDEAAFQTLYSELKRLASVQLGAERDRGVLQTTALVHETLLKLGMADGSQTWQSRAHFFGAAAIAMRRILVDEARRRKVEGRALRLLAAPGESGSHSVELMDLDEALAALERHDPALAKLVVLRVFGGMPTDQLATMLDRSVRTIGRDWRIARAWLLRWLIDNGRTDVRRQ